MGTKVKSPEGEEIGVIQNLIINPQHGTIVFIVLCYADFFGKMHRLFAIPNQFLAVKITNQSTIFWEIDQQKLINAHTASSNDKDDRYIYEILPDESKYAQTKRLVAAVP